MQIVFSLNGWEDYLYWQQHNKKIVKKINQLIKEIMRDLFNGLGKPEPLKNQLSGFWSRRITSEHRLVYKVEKNFIAIIACRYHY